MGVSGPLLPFSVDVFSCSERSERDTAASPVDSLAAGFGRENGG